MKNLKKVFKPNKIIGFITFNLSTILLLYIFINHLEETLLAYISYTLSTYSLIIFIIWFIEACRFTNHYIKENSKIYKKYKENNEKIIKLSLIISLTINLIYGLFKLYSGIYYHSEWFITFALYYLLLCFMKLSLIISIKRKTFGINLKEEYKKQKHTGIILLLLDFILSGIIILIIHHEKTIVYPKYIIYIVAIYDFYLIISALIDVIKYKKEKSPILISSKCINLTVAMISMISLEVAMIYEFGKSEEQFKIIMVSCTGLVVSLINSIMAIYMITNANKNLRKNNYKNSDIIKEENKKLK